MSISVNILPLSAKLASFMTRSIGDKFSELVFYKSQIGPGRKTGAQRGARGAKNNIWYDCKPESMRLEPTTNSLSVLDLENSVKAFSNLEISLKNF